MCRYIFMIFELVDAAGSQTICKGKYLLKRYIEWNVDFSSNIPRIFAIVSDECQFKIRDDLYKNANILIQKHTHCIAPGDIDSNSIDLNRIQPRENESVSFIAGHSFVDINGELLFRRNIKPFEFSFIHEIYNVSIVGESTVQRRRWWVLPTWWSRIWRGWLWLSWSMVVLLAQGTLEGMIPKISNVFYISIYPYEQLYCTTPTDSGSCKTSKA